MASPLESLATALAGTTRGVSVTVKSQITPDYTVSPFEPSAASDAPGIGSAFMGLIKPSFTLNTPAGSYPIEPWGKPTKSYGVALVLGMGLMGLGGYMAYRSYLKPWLRKKLG